MINLVYELGLFGCIFIVVGFLPVFFLLLSFQIRTRNLFIISFALSPALVAVFNTINVVLGIQNTWLSYIIAGIINTMLIYILIRKKKIAIIYQVICKIKYRLFIGLLFGTAYWFLFFYPYYKIGLLDIDLGFNLSLISEFRNHFPPVVPFWDTGGIMKYHYLTNMYFAGMINFTGLNIIQAVLKVGYLWNCIIIFIILSLVVRSRAIIACLIAFCCVLFLGVADSWPLMKSFHAHITGRTATTLFWSIPALLAAVYLWKQFDFKRNLISRGIGSVSWGNVLKVFLIILLAIFVLGFSKSTFLFLIISLEFISFIFFAFKNKLYLIVNLWIKKKELLSFTFIPIACFIFTRILSDKKSLLIPGIEMKDFYFFNSWNPIYPLIAFYSIILIYYLLGHNKKCIYPWIFMLAGFLNLVAYFLFVHSGGSDFYFGHNAVFSLGFIVLFDKNENKIFRYIIAYIILCFVVIAGNESGYFKGFNAFNINLTDYNIKPDDNFRSEEVNEYIRLSDSLPINALIATPKNDNIRTFSYSAFFARRFWNENYIYITSCISFNTIRLYFYKEQKFIPEYCKNFTVKPDNEVFMKELMQFHNNFKPEKYPELVNPNERFRLYNDVVFNNLDSCQIEGIIRNNHWTHILVLNKDINKINTWLLTRKKTTGQYVTLFSCY